MQHASQGYEEIYDDASNSMNASEQMMK